MARILRLQTSVLFYGLFSFLGAKNKKFQNPQIFFREMFQNPQIFMAEMFQNPQICFFIIFWS